MIRTDGVTVRFGARAIGLPDLVLEPGDAVGVSGPNGSGKSTLLRVLASLLRPESGRVVCPPPGRTVLLHQRPYLFRGTAARNVEWALARAGVPRGERRRRARETLDRLGAAAVADRSVGDLSGGERRRVALARVLSSGGEVLLLDEPLSALDEEGRRLATDAILETARTRVVASPEPVPALASAWIDLSGA